MIYIISNGRHIKIGKSNDPLKRCRNLQTGSSDKLELIASFKCYDDMDAETKIHSALDHARCEGEWFNASVYDAVEAIVMCGQLVEVKGKQQGFKYQLEFNEDDHFLDYLRQSSRDDYDYKTTLNSAITKENENIEMSARYERFLRDIDELGTIKKVLENDKRRAIDTVAHLNSLFDKSK